MSALRKGVFRDCMQCFPFLCSCQEMRGGKRKGAGRPPLNPDDIPEAVTIKAHPSAVARFKAWCIAKGLSQREAFEAWTRRMK